jgi:hypothetical protein
MHNKAVIEPTTRRFASFQAVNRQIHQWRKKIKYGQKIKSGEKKISNKYLSQSTLLRKVVISGERGF